ncbi:HET-domain-containing protein [Zopfia rhizophila CBS 207.26]|uniref:HET-domain-containing protein n=1 Tax=Zopfia rhizophila CBS 207.26 TaxID=1314779 RepID=A0A6A6ERB9_9PEZI|nr:HET-domain-containing protein [Zopfia rhizophila CBS 207.26]
MLCENCEAFSRKFTPSKKVQLILHESVTTLLDGSRSACHLCRTITTHLEQRVQMVDGENTAVVVKFAGDDLHFLVCLEPKSSEKSEAEGSVENRTAEKLRFGIQRPVLPAKIAQAIRSCGETEDSNTGSDVTFQLVAAWVTECLENHEKCHKAQSGANPLPTRVIDVGLADGSQQPFLYEPGKQEHGRYIALSHCWGKHELLRTKMENLVEHKKEIPLSSMPKTFADTVMVTRRLNVRYLWIDSVCIIQDDPKDWEKEAARMCGVYQNALLTIAATHAKDGAVGLFSARDGLATRPCQLPIGNQRATDGETGPVFICIDKMSYTWVMRVRPTPLHGRAWVLQEQLLSSRILSYENDSVSWRCQSMRFYEKLPLCQPLDTFIRETRSKQGSWKGDPRDTDAHVAQLQRRWITSPMAIGGQNLPLSFAANERKPEWDKLIFAWAGIVEDFTGRGLTYSSDRLVAIRGVSDAVSQYTNFKCIAGIWAVSLYKGLLWCTRGPQQRTGIAPTWSWASVDGGIHWPGLWSHHTDRLATILDVQESGTPAHSSGSIALEADIRPGIVGVRDSDKSRRVFLALCSPAYQSTPSWRFHSEEGESFTAVTPDVDKLGSPVSTDIELPMPQTVVWFAVIAISQLHGQTHDTQFIHTLLLQETGGGTGEFQRIGLVSWKNGDWKEPVKLSSEFREIGKVLPNPKRANIRIM